MYIFPNREPEYITMEAIHITTLTTTSELNILARPAQRRLHLSDRFGMMRYGSIVPIDCNPVI